MSVDLSLRLVHTIELGFELSLVSSINVLVELSSTWKYWILEKVTFNPLSLKHGIDNIGKVEFSLSTSYHILDSSSGVSYGSYYLDKTHGITL